MQPLLTIAIPTYLRAQYLRIALEKLSEQYDERLEVLVSNDASPDETDEIVNEMQRKFPIFYIKNEKNLGYDLNFIQCYKMAHGKYIMLMGNDDYVCDGGVKYILDYLEQNEDLDWISVNFTYYKIENSNHIESKVPMLKEVPDRANVSKKEFVEFAKEYITALSSIVCRERALEIDNIEKFVDTCFIQTYIPLEMTKQDNAKLGIIGKPVICYNQTYEPEKNVFYLFGEKIKNVLCTYAVQCGYDKNIIKKAYKRTILHLITPVVEKQASGDKEKKKQFWQYGYPAVKDFPIAWVTLIPLAILPTPVSKVLFYKIRPLLRRFKEFIICIRK